MELNYFNDSGTSPEWQSEKVFIIFFIRNIDRFLHFGWNDNLEQCKEDSVSGTQWQKNLEIF